MIKIFFKLFIFILFSIFSFCDISFCVPANPNSIEITQPDGTKITIKVKGDEFYGWHEDKDGYTIIKDTTTNFWSYAQINIDGSLKPSANLVGKQNPLSLGIKKSLKDETKIYNAKQIRKEFNSQLKETLKSNVSYNSSNNSSNNSSQIQKTSPISGTKTNFVLLVQFKDLKFSDNAPFKSKSDAEIIEGFDNLFNETNYTTDGAVGSVKDYFNEVSYGQLQYNSVISPIITIDQSYKYYAYDEGNISFYRVQAMIRSALQQLDDDGYNFKKIWPNGNVPEGFTVIHAGGGAENGNYDFIWSHKSSISFPITCDGITFSNYHTEPAGRGYYGSSGLIRIGVICHESIHFFGITDLYDTRQYATSEGLGKFCIMAGGEWNGSLGNCPCHPCAWIKYQLGWCSPQTVSEGTNYIGTSAKDNTAFYKLTSENFDDNEYFLIENKQGYGFDSYLPGSKRGLLIYHIDENQEDNDDPTHYLVDIEEADGSSDWTKDHLANSTNTGIDSDYYRNGTKTVFNDSCTASPNSRSYYKSSGVYKPSGIDISKISATGTTMSFYCPELYSFENFVDGLDDNGVKFVSFIMKYEPTKTKEELKNLDETEQNKIAQYFSISATGATNANNMASLYYSYIETGIVFSIGKEFTGKISSTQANLVIDLNNILLKSNQSITSIGNISSTNKSPLENETTHSDTIKRFTGITAVSNIQAYHKNYGTLIYSFDKMVQNKSYNIIEMTKDIDSDDYPNYYLLKGEKSISYNDLSEVICYPNPARDGYIYIARLPDKLEDFSIEIFTMTAKLVKSFSINDVIISSENKVKWDCKNENGENVAPGVYIVLIKNISQKKTFKIAVIR